MTALDPEASESLKVIAYFDALVEGHAGLEMLLRGAAVLCGCAAGFTTSAPNAPNAPTMRVDARGQRRRTGEPTTPAPAAAGEPWPTHPLPDGGCVWIERTGAPHANDAMVLERLAIGLSISLDRASPAVQERRALEILLAPDETPDARADAVRRLRLDGIPLVRIVAQPARETRDDPRGVVVETAAGRVRARILLPNEEQASNSAAPAGPAVDTVKATSTTMRVGIGTAAAPADLAVSWASAVLALRMTSPREQVLRADDLGVVLLAAEAADAGRATHPDVAAVGAVAAEARGGNDRITDALEVLDALARTDSVRAAATLAGVHHSTMQARAADLAEVLGFDPRMPAGRVRLSDALRLHRLATTRFE
ncbi:helix-turn-helix domain-containing protein [Herbiconiux sp. P17]|uniref:helix-turn-helix domain-containing protein n=1 Tax=Herbiconiux wuyangfengii TaxID=3342794 RepID=UPI0035B95971